MIPTRKDQAAHPKFDMAGYKRRNVIERCMGWIKENRRVGTRHEKLAVNFLAMVSLAMIRRCLRILESPDRTSGMRPERGLYPSCRLQVSHGDFMKTITKNSIPWMGSGRATIPGRPSNPLIESHPTYYGNQLVSMREGLPS